MRIDFVDLGDECYKAMMSFRDYATAKKLIDYLNNDIPVFPFTADEIISLAEGKEKPRRVQPEVIINGRTTIMKFGDKKFVSRPEKGERYDKEKGVLMCLAKAMGYSTSDILKMADNAKVFKNKK